MYVMYMSTLLNWYIIFSSWKPNCGIELQYVRHPPKQLEELDLTPGSKVEVCVCVCVSSCAIVCMICSTPTKFNLMCSLREIPSHHLSLI